MLPKRVLLIGIVGIAAVVAIGIAVTLVGNTSNPKAQSASERSGNLMLRSGRNSTSGNQTASNGASSKSYDFGNDAVNGTGEEGTLKPSDGLTADTSGSSKPSTSTSTEDPEKTQFTLHALAIGDWGVSPGGDSCCSKYVKQGEDLYRDQQAQNNVAYLLSLSCAALKPKAVLSHGDNFYWNGLGTEDMQYRFENMFEGVYNQKSMDGIPWLNVMGNHDYGGSAYLCGESDDTWRACKTEKEMVAALESRFSTQSTYKSPNGDRWKMPSHYYVETLKDAASGTTVDIFNVDTNAATVHGAEQVCCQCYGYMGPLAKTDPDYVNCNTVHRGHRLCFGGDTKLFDSCVAKFKVWTDDSLMQLQRDAQASKADWKVVNSHYSPHYHMEPTMMKTWFDALEKSGIQLFINGHTHAESHDIATFKTHFITNGAGGGVQSESIGKPPPHVTNVEMIWSGKNSPYGFFELSFSKQWLRARFITFDQKWSFAEDATATVRGSTAVGHCWYIPKDGSTGKECAAS